MSYEIEELSLNLNDLFNECLNPFKKKLAQFDGFVLKLFWC